MATTEKKIHYLKARNSDYLAGIDLEVFALEGKSNTLTVKDVQYKENFIVNGRKKERGLVMTFQEPYAKPFIVNPTNSRIIKDQTGVIDAVKWIGFSIQFYFNTDVEMKRKKVGGIRVKNVNTNGLVPAIEDIKTRIEKCTNRAELMAIWGELSETEQNTYKEVATLKSKSF